MFSLRYGCRAPAPRCPKRSSLARIDFALFHALNSGIATRDWLEDPLTALVGLAVPAYAVATIGLWFLARPYGSLTWKLASFSALSAGVLAMVASQIVSHVWGRPRPFVLHSASTHLLSAPPPDPSFPSAYAATAFAIAFAVLVFSRTAGAGFLVAASLIGVSRVVLGLHYPSDVLAGLVVGWAAAMFVTEACMPWIVRLVAFASRVTDPLLVPLWNAVARRTSLGRF